VVIDPVPGLILALDQGGHGSRAVLFDSRGGEIAASHVVVATRVDEGGFVEQDPLELVSSLERAALDACESPAAAGRTISAAGLATQRSTIVCWERSSGRALTNAISWQDRRNADWLKTLEPRAEEIRELTGLVLSPHYGASKLRWCLDNVPAVRHAAERGNLTFGPLSSWLLRRLLEERPEVADPANASRTLLFDPETLDWSPTLLDAFDIGRECLPACVRTRHAYGFLHVGARSIPVTACTGDQSAAAFAFGMPDARVALVNVGTGAFVQRAASADAPLPVGMLRSVLSSGSAGAVYSQEGTVNGAGSAVDWLRGRSALDVERALHSLTVRPGDDVPLFMNGVGGLGAPFWLSEFPVEFVTDGDDTLRLAAVVESIAFLIGINLDAMQHAAALDSVRISGGMAGCDYLCQTLADLCRLPVHRHAQREATARGAAFLAAGNAPQWQAVPIERSFEPQTNGPLAARFRRWLADMERRGATVP
jgi:glycerol kinase